MSLDSTYQFNVVPTLRSHFEVVSCLVRLVTLAFFVLGVSSVYFFAQNDKVHPLSTAFRLSSPAYRTLLLPASLKRASSAMSLRIVCTIFTASRVGWRAGFLSPLYCTVYFVFFAVEYFTRSLYDIISLFIKQQLVISG